MTSVFGISALPSSAAEGREAAKLIMQASKRAKTGARARRSIGGLGGSRAEKHGLHR
jgi:hypothetical protein